MEAAALSLLLAHQSGVLNPLVDVIVPVYTLVVLWVVYSVHAQQRQLIKSGSSPEKTQEGIDGTAGNETELESISEEPPLAEGARPNYTGVWKSIPSKNVNYDKFLEYQGVPYMKRAVASRTTIVHSIEHEGDQFKLEVQPLGMKTVFNIDGEPTQSMIGKKPFEDKMTWGPRGELKLVKLNKEDQMEVVAVRSLTKGGRYLVMKQSVKNLKDHTEVEAEQTFEKSA